MTIDEDQMAGIVKLAFEEAEANGEMTDDEKDFIVSEVTSFGWEYDQIYAEANQLSHKEAVALMRKMPADRKKYACSLIGYVIAKDGDVDNAEAEKWIALSEECRFPNMSLSEAMAFIDELNS